MLPTFCLSLQVLVVQGKGGRVIKPSAVWKNNLDWGPDDTLELSLGEAGTALRLDRAMLRRNAVPDIRRAWKVRHDRAVLW